MTEKWLIKFVAESNKIEGYIRAPYDKELTAHEKILASEALTVPLIQEFVSIVAPRHVLRDREGLDVQVGNHIAPRGGDDIRPKLDRILEAASHPMDPYHIHLEYEYLHPFTDGNGRSGRAIWLWGMQKQHKLNWVMELGFLHNFYYQTLGAQQ